MPLPTFLIIGAPKCGSTALYQHLAADPRIVMSATKEPAFFGARADRGQAWYEEQFVGEGEAIGEATVGYLSDPASPERIRRVVPEARLVALTRNPFDRARSHYWWRFNNGAEERSLDAVLADGADAFPIADGLYFRNLSRFRNVFPAEQLLVLRDDELRVGRASLDRLWEFIGVAPPSDRPVVKSANQARKVRGQGTGAALAGLHKLRNLRSYVPPGVRRLGARVVQRADDLGRTAFVAPPLTEAQVDVLAEHFLPDLDDLEEMIGADLSSWRSPSCQDDET